jgi:hypothetical protein
MGDLVNLRQAKKRKARAARESAAAQNRARFGVPKAERDRRAAQEDLERKRLEALKLETPGRDD